LRWINRRPRVAVRARCDVAENPHWAPPTALPVARALHDVTVTLQGFGASDVTLAQPRSFLGRIAKGGVLAGGALALVTGQAQAIEPATDHDPTDTRGYGRGG
jgi:hypothetical protein